MNLEQEFHEFVSERSTVGQNKATILEDQFI
jgi:hypothetical protein